MSGGRRISRRPGRSAGIGGGSGGVSQRPPLPTTAYEYWHSELGASSASAVGQIQGHTLTGTGTPVVGVDADFFKGRQVYQSATTGSKGWSATGFTTTLGAGSRPYIAAVCRTRVLQAASGLDITAFDVGGGAGGATDQSRLIWESNGTGNDSFSYVRRHNGGSVYATSGDIQDQGVHFFEIVMDATLGDLLYMDGVQIASTLVGSVTDGITTAVDRFAIGKLAAGASNFSNTSLAFLLVCTAVPTAGERAALYSWARRYWIDPAATFADILGSNLLFEFDARYQSSVGSWTDRRRGYVATPPGTATTYAADGSNFNGLPVHQCAVTGSAVLRVSAPSPVVWSAGARPYMFSVCRARTYPAGTAFVGTRVLDSAAALNTIGLQAQGGTNMAGLVDAQGASAAFTNTGVHAFEVWTEAGGTFLAIDGVTVGTGTATTLTNNSNHISFGGSHTGTLVSDSSHALHLACQTVPTATQRAQILALARSIWGF